MIYNFLQYMYFLYSVKYFNMDIYDEYIYNYLSALDFFEKQQIKNLTNNN